MTRFGCIFFLFQDTCNKVKDRLEPKKFAQCAESAKDPNFGEFCFPQPIDGAKEGGGKEENTTHT